MLVNAQRGDYEQNLRGVAAATRRQHDRDRESREALNAAPRRLGERYARGARDRLHNPCHGRKLSLFNE